MLLPYVVRTLAADKGDRRGGPRRGRPSDPAAAATVVTMQPVSTISTRTSIPPMCSTTRRTSSAEPLGHSRTAGPTGFCGAPDACQSVRRLNAWSGGRFGRQQISQPLDGHEPSRPIFR